MVGLFLAQQKQKRTAVTRSRYQYDDGWLNAKSSTPLVRLVVGLGVGSKEGAVVSEGTVVGSFDCSVGASKGELVLGDEVGTGIGEPVISIGA
jgi:hypothetical protein